MKDLIELRDAMRAFSAEREWGPFHTPKNLVMAMSVEMAELLEHFQWLTEAQSQGLSEEELAAVAEEVADVQIYLVRLADVLGIDVMDAVTKKMGKNAEKYPAEVKTNLSGRFVRPGNDQNLVVDD